MEVSEIFEIGSVVAILLTLLGMGLVIIRHIDLRFDQLEARVKVLGTSLDTKLKSAGTRISDAEREQTRQEGENRLLERLDHGHERGD